MLDYNNPQEKYEEQTLIPNGLKQQEYENQLALGHPRRAEYLKTGPKEKMRYLPKGIHEYALTNPREVNLYQKELAAQSAYLNVIKQIVKESEGDLSIHEKIRDAFSNDQL